MIRNSVAAQHALPWGAVLKCNFIRVNHNLHDFSVIHSHLKLNFIDAWREPSLWVVHCQWTSWAGGRWGGGGGRDGGGRGKERGEGRATRQSGDFSFLFFFFWRSRNKWQKNTTWYVTFCFVCVCVCVQQNNMKGNHKHSSSSADHTESPQHGHEVWSV